MQYPQKVQNLKFWLAMRMELHAHCLRSTVRPKNASELGKTPNEYFPPHSVVSDTSERKGPTVAILGDSHNTAIGKVSREGTGALGAADGLFGFTVIYPRAFGLEETCSSHVERI
jgi:hypothetical protein